MFQVSFPASALAHALRLRTYLIQDHCSFRFQARPF